MHVHKLYIYPIKSCSGIEVEELTITQNGPEWDRKFMLIDKNNKFLTQRALPNMGLITTGFRHDGLQVGYLEKGSITISKERFEKTAFKAVIWKDSVDVYRADNEINEFFTDILKIPCRLVQLEHDLGRTRMINNASASSYQVKFADSAPFLLTNTASLLDLNQRLANPISMDRFRPNIVMDSSEAFIEDQWQQLRVGEIEMYHTWPCSRCVITTIDPITREKSKEPLATLSKYRQRAEGICFGTNLVHRNQGKIRIKDSISPI